jgi:hypothetical protein
MKICGNFGLFNCANLRKSSFAIMAFSRVLTNTLPMQAGNHPCSIHIL